MNEDNFQEIIGKLQVLVSRYDSVNSDTFDQKKLAKILYNGIKDILDTYKAEDDYSFKDDYSEEEDEFDSKAKDEYNEEEDDFFGDDIDEIIPVKKEESKKKSEEDDEDEISYIDSRIGASRSFSFTV